MADSSSDFENLTSMDKHKNYVLCQKNNGNNKKDTTDPWLADWKKNGTTDISKSPKTMKASPVSEVKREAANSMGDFLKCSEETGSSDFWPMCNKTVSCQGCDQSAEVKYTEANNIGKEKVSFNVNEKFLVDIKTEAEETSNSVIDLPFICCICCHIFKTDEDLCRHQWSHVPSRKGLLTAHLGEKEDYEIGVEPEACRRSNSNNQKSDDESATEKQTFTSLKVEFESSGSKESDSDKDRFKSNGLKSENLSVREKIDSFLLTSRKRPRVLREMDIDRNKAIESDTEKQRNRSYTSHQTISENCQEGNQTSYMHHDQVLCHFCGKVFKQMGNLNSHINVHLKSKPNKCKECGLGFSDPSNLLKHMRLHSRDNHRFKCDVCGACYIHSNSYKYHLTTHMTIKPFSCSICNKTFGQKCKLNNHLKIHSAKIQLQTNTKYYHCDVCNKSFLDDSNFRRHKMIHNGEKPQACSHCPYRCITRKDLQKHFTRRHKTNKS